MTPYAVTYNGAATRLPARPRARVAENLNSLLVLGGTTHTKAGTYPSDAGPSPATRTITAPAARSATASPKANAVITVTPYSVTYDGTAHTATGTATGRRDRGGGPEPLLNLSGTTHTNAGHLHQRCVDLRDGNGNYNNTNGTVSDSIAKAERDHHRDALHRDLQRRGAHGDRHGHGRRDRGGDLSALLNLSGTTHTNAGTYTSDAWTFATATATTTTPTARSVTASPRPTRPSRDALHRDLRRRGAHRDRHGHGRRRARRT